MAQAKNRLSPSKNNQVPICIYAVSMQTVIVAALWCIDDAPLFASPSTDRVLTCVLSCIAFVPNPGQSMASPALLALAF